MLVFKAPIPTEGWIIGCEIVFSPNKAAPAIVDGKGGDGCDGKEVVEDGEASTDTAGDEDVWIIDSLLIFNYKD